MPNGGGPPDRVLQDADFQTIKDGLCITEGSYTGCIKVGAVHYWVYGSGSYWVLASGLPDESQSEISEDVWDKCKNGGSLSWDATRDQWTDGKHFFGWAGYVGSDVILHEVSE